MVLFLIITTLLFGEDLKGESIADINSQIATLTVGIDTLWVMIGSFLVFFMNLGFAMVEAGLARAKIQ